MPTILLTGANRGLGLEFVRQYAAEGWRVHACCRNPAAASELAAVEGDVVIHALDVADLDATAALAGSIDEPIDVLLANAGIYGNGPDGKNQTFGALDYAHWVKTLQVNTLAPLRLAECFIEHVVKGEQKRILAVTSKMGSIADNTSGGAYLYRSSKAGLNAAFRSLAHDLAGRAISVAVMHPGWVQTDMGGTSAPMTIPDSVRGMRGVIASLDATGSGRFFLHDGSELPW